MKTLKPKAANIVGEFDPPSRLVYVDHLLHLLATCFIKSGVEQFFREHKLSFASIDESVVSIHHGGGNLGDLSTATTNMPTTTILE